MSVPDVVQKRKNWIECLPEYDKNNFVFIDESGVNTDLTRIYGRAIDGERCVDKIPLNTPQNTTILSSVRYNGETVYTVYQGGTTSDKFSDYLKNILAPTLHKNDIVVMDNMRTHRSKEVKKVIEELKINVVYLPPYSPDFNPIEKMWSKIKSVLRKLKVRILEDLPDAIKYSFSKVCASDCLGWFNACFIYYCTTDIISIHVFIIKLHCICINSCRTHIYSFCPCTIIIRHRSCYCVDGSSIAV